MEGKKISFGFTKTKKAEKAKEEESKEYITCVEENFIKVIAGEKVEENVPIVIPMKPNTLVTAEKLMKIAQKVEKDIADVIEEKVVVKEEAIPENETLEQMAVRELTAEAKNEVKEELKELTLPVPDKLIADGAKESTLQDYESIPIQDFGMAMLRGMGWDPKQEKSKFKQPELRPKGLGLGADKVVKANQKKKSKEEEELTIEKNSFVKITMGKHNGYYGKVVSLDEDNGRVMVDITMKKETVSLSEFMMEAVTKSEYDKEAKVINKHSYEAYKKKEESGQSQKNSDSKLARDESTDKDSKQSAIRDKKEKNEDKYEKHYGTNKSRERCHRGDKHVERPRSLSHSSSSSSSPDTRRHRSKHKSKRRHKYELDSSDSEKKYRSTTPSAKRDIDKKRKGKKKKRDRDRSPIYRKYRK